MTVTPIVEREVMIYLSFTVEKTCGMMQPVLFTEVFQSCYRILNFFILKFKA